MSERPQLDRERVEGMAKVMLEAIRENHLRGPLGRDRVFEALNALAFCVGVSIAGAGAAGGAKEAKRFFDLALRQAIIEAGKLEQPRPRYSL